MRFIGNKEKLISQIYDFYKEVMCENSSTKNPIFFDFFSGSASVGKFFKKLDYQIYSCDLLYCSYCLQKAYLENTKELTFKRLDEISTISSQSLFVSPYQKVLEYLNQLQGINGFIYKNYSPSGSKKLQIPRMYFSDENARKIDAIRTQIESWKQLNKINENEYFVLLASLLESVSLFANVAGVYGAFCKTWDKRALKDFKLKEIEPLQSNHSHSCFCDDSLKVLEKYKHITFDILYLDPPYNQRQYAPNYHLLETIARYDNPDIKGIAGLREWQNQKSNFCNTKSALLEFEKIANFKNYKTLILSYNSEGLMKKEQIDKILKPLGRLYFKEIAYRRFKSNAIEGKNYISEYIWVLKK